MLQLWRTHHSALNTKCISLSLLGLINRIKARMERVRDGKGSCSRFWRRKWKSVNAAENYLWKWEMASIDGAQSLQLTSLENSWIASWTRSVHSSEKQLLHFARHLEVNFWWSSMKHFELLTILVLYCLVQLLSLRLKVFLNQLAGLFSIQYQIVYFIIHRFQYICVALI